MADKKKISRADLEKIANKSSLAVTGVTQELDDESDLLRKTINSTIVATSKKYGSRANGQVINYFNEINHIDVMGESLARNKLEKLKDKPENKKIFKDYMNSQEIGDVSNYIMGNSNKLIQFRNYQAIYEHIPEMSQAIAVYRDNILSPDDFTKLIFDINYEDGNERLKEVVEERLKLIRNKYDIERLAEKLITGALVYGEQYQVVLSMEDELSAMLSDPAMNSGLLNESTIRTADPSVAPRTLDSKDIVLNEEERGAMEDYFRHLSRGKEILTEEPKKGKVLKENQVVITEDRMKKYVADIVNNNILIGSSKELLLEKLEAERTENRSNILTDIPGASSGRRKKKLSRDDGKPTHINGSTMRTLDPSKVIELKIDNVIYGYYLVEDFNRHLAQDDSGAAAYLGAATSREVANPVTGGGGGMMSSNNDGNHQYGKNLYFTDVPDSNVQLISKIFLDNIAKKINKEYIRHNREFKELLFNLVRQEYILTRGLKLTFFTPDEVIAIKTEPIFKNIVFFAKIYMAVLTNMILIKMGRAHDKRVFYVEVGLDNNAEQAVSRVIQDIKTKEFRMDSVDEINTVLNINPGRFHDYFIPTINGEKPIDIDVIQGMDVDLNEQFVEWLKTSMSNGVGVPKALIDSSTEIDFARTLSAVNANFIRSVIKHQIILTPQFTRLIRKLYENEFRYSTDGKISEDNQESINIEKISVVFPPPATLNLSNLIDQVTSAQQLAEAIGEALVVDDPMNPTRGDVKAHLKAKLFKKYAPGIDFDEINKLLEEAEKETSKDRLNTKAQKKPGVSEDPFMT